MHAKEKKILVGSILELRDNHFYLIYNVVPYPRYWVPVPGVLIVWRVYTDPSMPPRRLAGQPWSCLGVAAV